jgi:hypothetical protein
LVVIKHAEDLKIKERIFKAKRMGAVLVPSDLGRGINLMFAVDALVVVLCNGD